MVNTTDSSLILVFSYCDSLEIEGRIFDSHESPESRSLAKHNQSLSQGLPVPRFETEEYGGKTLCGLASDFNLYLIEAKLGKYLEDKYLQDWWLYAHAMEAWVLKGSCFERYAQCSYLLGYSLVT